MPRGKPEQPSDRLDEMAEELHEAPYSQIRAALEALVRDCADVAWSSGYPGDAILARYGLKEKP